MAPDTTLLFESGDLTICPERGEVRSSQGESVRLGPVNMKVLTALLSRPGEVVSRGELFDIVWRNQLVSDDALTRAISDIRSQLSHLSGCDTYIETLPKRGYRWTAEVRTASPPRNAPVEAPARAKPTTAERRWPLNRRGLLSWAVRGFAYLAALVFIASLGVWLMDRFARPGLPLVAVLPTRAAASQLDLAASVDEELSEYLMDLQRVELLSKSAVESRPSNPFPYFHYEFGARWLIESELRNSSKETLLTVVLVDARTGIVLLQSTEPIPSDGRPAGPGIAQVLRPVADFMDSQ